MVWIKSVYRLDYAVLGIVLDLTFLFSIGDSWINYSFHNSKNALELG